MGNTEVLHGITGVLQDNHTKTSKLTMTSDNHTKEDKRGRHKTLSHKRRTHRIHLKTPLRTVIILNKIHHTSMGITGVTGLLEGCYSFFLPG